MFCTVTFCTSATLHYCWSSSKTINLIYCHPKRELVFMHLVRCWEVRAVHEWNNPNTHAATDRTDEWEPWCGQTLKTTTIPWTKVNSRKQKVNAALPEIHPHPQSDELFSGLFCNSVLVVCRAASPFGVQWVSTSTSSVSQMQPAGSLFASACSHSSSDTSNHVSRAVLSLPGDLPAE